MTKMAAWWVALFLATSACGGASSAPKAAEAEGAASPAGQLVTPPGSRVSLWLPAGTERPMRMLVFVRVNPTISLAIVEMTAKDEKVAAEMLNGGIEGVEDKGLTRDAPVSRGGASGFLARGEKGGLPMKVLVLRHGLALTTISVQYEAAATAEVDKILESIALNQSAALDPLAMHGVAVRDLRGFEVWPVASQPILLREPGTEPPFPAEAPTLFIMVVPYEEPNPSDEYLGRVLGSVLVKLEPNMEQAKESKLEVDGRPGFEIVVPGKNDGVDVDVYAFVARGRDSALAGVGHVGKKRSAEVMKRFSDLARSIKLDDSILGPVAR
jgi:hypothetical protein